MSDIAWLRSEPPFPRGGRSFSLRYDRNTVTPRNHAERFQALLAPLFGAPLFPGSLNLWASRRLDLPEPAAGINGAWHFWPVVLRQEAAGVMARRAEGSNGALVEVFAALELAPRLGLEPGHRLDVRILPGALLGLDERLRLGETGTIL